MGFKSDAIERPILHLDLGAGKQSSRVCQFPKLSIFGFSKPSKDHRFFLEEEQKAFLSSAR